MTHEVPDRSDGRRPLRVLHLSRDRSGGAARMTLLLHRGLLGQGVDSSVLTQEGGLPMAGVSTASPPWRARIQERLDRGPLVAYPRRTRAPYSPSLVPGGLPPVVARLRPDVVHLHWLGGGFLSLAELGRLPGPLVITLHDMWWFTGGCHYTAGCDRHRDRCGHCPVLGSGRLRDLSTLHQRLKVRGLGRADVTWVAISRWIEREARSSRVLGAHPGLVVPNGIDLDAFVPGDRYAARRSLGLPSDAKVVAFGAVAATSDPRKGFDLLVAALGRVRAKIPGALMAVVFGDAGRGEVALPFDARFLGTLADPSEVAQALGAADLVVVPSRQEGFGLVTAEAMACGRPVVAFEETGAEDLIEHRRSGWLADPGSADALAQGIEWVLSDGDRAARMGRRARGRVEARFDINQVARRYREIYERAARMGPGMSDSA